MDEEERYSALMTFLYEEIQWWEGQERREGLQPVSVGYNMGLAAATNRILNQVKAIWRIPKKEKSGPVVF